MAVNREIGVYVLHNTKNDKMYVGSSVCITRRLKEHKSFLSKRKHYNNHLQAAYNIDAEYFEFKTFLKTETQEEALVLEQRLIDDWDLFNKGYNQCKHAVTRKPNTEKKSFKMSDSHKDSLRGPRPLASKEYNHNVKPFHVYDKHTKIYLGK